MTPLAVFLRNRDFNTVKTSVFNEAKLSHSDITVLEVSFAYCLAIKQLIKNGDRKKAFDEVKGTAKREISDFESFFTQLNNSIENNQELPIWNVDSSHFSHGFANAVKFLKYNFDFKTAIEHMALRGGDADANCAIVGGLIGAAEGYSKIPKEWKDKINNWEYSNSKKNGIQRPNKYTVKHNIPRIEQFFKSSPLGKLS